MFADPDEEYEGVDLKKTMYSSSRKKKTKNSIRQDLLTFDGVKTFHEKAPVVQNKQQSKYIEGMMKEAERRRLERKEKDKAWQEKKLEEQDEIYGRKDVLISEEYRKLMERKGRFVMKERRIQQNDHLDNSSPATTMNVKSTTIQQEQQKDTIPFPELTPEQVNFYRERYLKRKPK
jgi:hypothetical protein